ncbi:MAG: hypothetical protein SPH79_06185 [Schaalia hyovaginalis]|uniref:Centromere-binding protein ParB C-terminal domain-containing protein n=1 Tax=Schaalia hyovaginalis TaxID=29316 RepID=A0A923IY51_9ACTO|nr:hypothetical protein [Schaalia hyovaginalis]MBB6335123.1 hypothetical protein [Schaalia hyovaginalis]MDY6214061.1 hypothetical protein [Schaalia hyovaginalis]
MTRIEPRKSALSASVVAPSASNDGKSGNAGKGGVVDRPMTRDQAKLTVRISEDLLEEARSAFWQTGPQTGTRSLSAWVADAIAAKLERDRAAFNGGRRFDPVPAGEIPTGRRS